MCSAVRLSLDRCLAEEVMIVPNICKDEQHNNFTKLFALRVSISLRRRTIILDVIMMLDVDFNFHAKYNKNKNAIKNASSTYFMDVLNANLCLVQKKKIKDTKMERR